MDAFVYGSIAVLTGFIVWMIYQFIKEWPNYSRKKSK